jgi:hypothetical protein
MYEHAAEPLQLELSGFLIQTKLAVHLDVQGT